jgi:hypothetical protein
MRFEPAFFVHLGARLKDHVVGEEPIFGNIGRRVADQRDLGVAVEIDFLKVVVILQVVDTLRLVADLFVPAGLADRFAHFDEVHQLGVVAQEVRVRVHDELARESLGALVGHFRSLRFGGRGVEQQSVDLVHRDEAGGHAGGALEEAAAREALSGCDRIGHVDKAGLHFLLLRRLR